MHAEKLESFEAFLFRQSEVLTQTSIDNFTETLHTLIINTLEWFEIDRLTIFPGSNILFSEGKTLSVSRDHVAPLNVSQFQDPIYADYFKLLKSKSLYQLFDHKELETHKFDVLSALAKSGAREHGMIKLELYGANWGGLCFTRFKDQPDIEMNESQMQRLKMLGNMWLCFWQHLKVSKSLNSVGDSCSVLSSTTDDEKILLLSDKQLNVLSLLAKGYTAKECGERLFLSSRTIESHKYRMIELLDLSNNTELVQFALRNDLAVA
ncbi:response regulator transcription factor [Vibrio superstes]|uniref:HTH luxR-type domain-containing protein n=1 Tax=Vibrio superstes NBRC 103154 TaxID=1219062 RepID=A0A511QNZ0_9VIBR|nr:LuxR C-terminal-related transcriptional regulator [Vibrio superstes]GEM79034.1 hypothetical protein VSU01S_12790 [Vibrio superstes NBRC 103154]